MLQRKTHVKNQKNLNLENTTQLFVSMLFSAKQKLNNKVRIKKLDLPHSAGFFMFTPLNKMKQSKNGQLVGGNL